VLVLEVKKDGDECETRVLFSACL
jgi:hypothetical protein